MARAAAFGFGELREELAARPPLPVYVLHGEEDLLREEAEQLIVDRALAKEERGFNLDILHAGEADPADVVARASSFPMMAARRVVIVRDADRLKPPEPLEAYFAVPQKETCLILTAAKVDVGRRPFARSLASLRVVEFPPLPDEELPEWITRRVADLGRTITPGGASLLAASAGSLLREASSEIEKLLLFVGERTDITEADVAALAGFTREFSMAELLRAVGARDTARAVTILDRMLEMGESGPGIVFMLTRFFSNLWKLQDLRQREPRLSQWERGRRAGVWRNEWDPLNAAARAFTSGELERSFAVLCSADEQLKSTGTDPRALLLAMIVRLTARSTGHA